MQYFNTPYAQQAYQAQMMPQYVYGPMYPPPPSNYQQPSPPKIDFQGAVVNTYDEVRGYPIPQDGTILLLNKTCNKLYLKSLRDGVPMIEAYDFYPATVPIEEPPKDTIVESIGKLENMINMLANRMNTYENKANLNKN